MQPARAAFGRLRLRGAGLRKPMEAPLPVPCREGIRRHSHRRAGKLPFLPGPFQRRVRPVSSLPQREPKKPLSEWISIPGKNKKSFGNFAVPFDTLVNFCLPPLVNRITGRCLAYHLLTFHRPLAIIPASRVRVIVSAFPWQVGRSLIYRNMVEK